MDTISLTPQMLQNIIADAVSQGIRAYEAGKGGEVSYRKGLEMYGRWFAEAVRRGDLQGLRRGDKANSKITYQVRDIEALRAEEIAKASRIIDYTK